MFKMALLIYSFNLYRRRNRNGGKGIPVYHPGDPVWCSG